MSHLSSGHAFIFSWLLVLFPVYLFWCLKLRPNVRYLAALADSVDAQRGSQREKLTFNPVHRDSQADKSLLALQTSGIYLPTIHCDTDQMPHRDRETCRSKGYQIDFMTVVFRGTYQQLYGLMHVQTRRDDSEHIALRTESGGWRFGCGLSFLPLCDRPLSRMCCTLLSPPPLSISSECSRLL